MYYICLVAVGPALLRKIDMGESRCQVRGFAVRSRGANATFAMSQSWIASVRLCALAELILMRVETVRLERLALLSNGLFCLFWHEHYAIDIMYPIQWLT